jgi:hypothetical protein
MMTQERDTEFLQAIREEMKHGQYCPSYEVFVDLLGLAERALYSYALCNTKCVELQAHIVDLEELHRIDGLDGLMANFPPN